LNFSELQKYLQDHTQVLEFCKKKVELLSKYSENILEKSNNIDKYAATL